MPHGLLTKFGSICAWALILSAFAPSLQSAQGSRAPPIVINEFSLGGPGTDVQHIEIRREGQASPENRNLVKITGGVTDTVRYPFNDYPVVPSSRVIAAAVESSVEVVESVGGKKEPTVAVGAFDVLNSTPANAIPANAATDDDPRDPRNGFDQFADRTVARSDLSKPGSVDSPIDIRVATFNASLYRSKAGRLIDNLSEPDDLQARRAAETVQISNPDIILINEFDYDAAGEAADLFRRNYLEISQNGQDPVFYAHVYVAPSNTGIQSGFDLDNDGSVGGGTDALGFGNFPGQFGFVIYSKYDIVETGIRTFRKFLWKDMPGALLPDDLDTPAADDWYSKEELEIFRLSSKNHVDVPVNVNGRIVHILAAHPTPPVFDGPENRNGLRNHDEIRLFADYITPGAGNYIRDDNGNCGGLGAGARFVILGDYNSDPNDGESLSPGASDLFLRNPFIDNGIVPTSAGAVEQTLLQGADNLAHLSDPAADTADFRETPFGPGNLRVDYALPSKSGFELLDARVFWPLTTEPTFNDLAGAFPFPVSDHRLVSVDLAFDAEDRMTVAPVDARVRSGRSKSC